MSKLTFYTGKPEVDIITGACPHDCPDTCSWEVAVDRLSGKAIDIWGHADHPDHVNRHDTSPSGSK